MSQSDVIFNCDCPPERIDGQDDLLPEGATYAELTQMPLPVVQALAEANPSHIAVQNALRELEREDKANRQRARLGRETTTRTDGMTRSRFAHKGGRRCPTKKELR